MSLRRPAMAALLSGLLACGVLPTDDAGVAVDRATPAVVPDALATVRDVIDDPLVQALVAGISDAASRRRVGEALGTASRAAANAEPGAMDGALLAAQREIGAAGAVEDQPVRAALSLLLDHAGAVIAAGATDTRQRRAVP